LHHYYNTHAPVCQAFSANPRQKKPTKKNAKFCVNCRFWWEIGERDREFDFKNNRVDWAEIEKDPAEICSKHKTAARCESQRAALITDKPY
jgi:hypothetical protein